MPTLHVGYITRHQRVAHPLLLCLQVYYLYRRPIHAQSTMPTLWLGAFRLLRLICIREAISLVHCHQAFSTLGGEALVQARTMGYKVRTGCSCHFGVLLWMLRCCYFVRVGLHCNQAVSTKRGAGARRGTTR